MIKKLLLSILLIVPFIYASPSDTLTYKLRVRKSKINEAFIDVTSGALRTITSDHSRVHNYEAFSVNKIDTLADGEKSVIAVYTGDCELHLKYVNVWSEKSPNKVCIYENPDTIRLSTDTLTVNNRNRDDNIDNILFPSETIVTDSVDTAGIMTLLDPSFFGGGTGIGGSSYAGSSPNEIEWIFGPEQYFVVCIENLSGDPALTTLCIFWYELKE